MRELRRTVGALPWDQPVSAAAVAAATAAVDAFAAVADIAGAHHTEALALASSVCSLCIAATDMPEVSLACLAALGRVLEALGHQRVEPGNIGEWTALLVRSEPPVTGISAESTLAYFEAFASALRSLAAASPAQQAAEAGAPAVFAQHWAHDPTVAACVPPLLAWTGRALDAAVAAARAGDGGALAAAVARGSLAAQDALPNHFALMNGLWKRTAVRAIVELIPSPPLPPLLAPPAACRGPDAARVVCLALSRALHWAETALQGFVPCEAAPGASAVAAGAVLEATGTTHPPVHPWDASSFRLLPTMLAPAWQQWSGGAAGDDRVPAHCWNPWLSDPLASKTLPVTLLFFLLQVC